MQELVIGIDSSTTATKCVAWDRQGQMLAEGRASIALDNPAPGRYEQHPQDWWDSLVQAAADLRQRTDISAVKALVVSNQRETVAFLDDNMQETHPAIIWLDERCRDYVEPFSAQIGADNIHRITGKHKDITPVVYRLAWMRECAPQAWQRTACFIDVHAYLVFRLCGERVTSWASADPSGCWDIVNKTWSETVLTALGLSSGQFPRAVPPGAFISEISKTAAQQTGFPAGTPIFAGGGDGQCAGLGIGITAAGNAYINLGTAVVSGCYADEYCWSNAWRTMTSMTAAGYIAESCLRAGTFQINWLVEDIFGGESFAELEARARLLPPGSDGLLLLPYLCGVMNPHWDAGASGAIVGFTSAHRREHLYRATMEGIAMELALAADAMAQHGIGANEYCVVGGGSKSDLWCSIIADVTAKPVLRYNTAEASALGAGIIAARGCGWYDDIHSAAAAMKGEVQKRFDPSSASRAEQYRDVLAIYGDFYKNIRHMTTALAQLRAKQRNTQ